MTITIQNCCNAPTDDPPLDSFDPMQHPGLSMVRVVMYLFIIFVIMWNINASFYIFSIHPDLTLGIDDPGYCHPVAYRMAFVLVIIFITISGLLFSLWLGGIIAGMTALRFPSTFGVSS